MIILIVYWVAGYWAVGKTIYANRMTFAPWNEVIIQKMSWAFILGWLLILVAIIKTLLGK